MPFLGPFEINLPKRPRFHSISESRLHRLRLETIIEQKYDRGGQGRIGSVSISAAGLPVFVKTYGARIGNSAALFLIQFQCMVLGNRTAMSTTNLLCGTHRRKAISGIRSNARVPEPKNTLMRGFLMHRTAAAAERNAQRSPS